MIDVLIPTFNRPDALAITLFSLVWQEFRDFRVSIADQSGGESVRTEAVRAVLRFMDSKGIEINVYDRIPGKGIAANRDFLLSVSSAPRILFLDDDLIVESDVVRRLVNEIERQQCGFVGNAPIGLSFLDDIRPQEQMIEFWESKVEPERVRPGTPAWERHKLHNAANILHLQKKLGLKGRDQRAYKIAWIGACVLYDAKKLRDCGGFGFWRKLPEKSCGEDVYAQLQVMERYGGCGIIPSGVYHQELTTTVPDRRNNALSLLNRA